MATASDPICFGSPTFFETFIRASGSPTRTRTPDQALEFRCEPRKVRRAAGEHDLADAQGAGLVLVVLQRGDELARERLDRLAQRLHACRRQLGRETFGKRRVGERQLVLDVLDL